MPIENLAVASGKGGTGKTLIATALASYLARRGRNVTYVDADVEAPNGHLFLPIRERREETARVFVPESIPGKCTGCGKCQSFCAFNALLVLKDSVMVFDELCHGCGGCLRVCPEEALRFKPRDCGTITTGQFAPSGRFRSGTLRPGEAMATPLIEQVLRLDDPADAGGIKVLDSPPGTSCSAMAVVEAADYVVLVTEPTPFGRHDLELALGMVEKMGKPAGVVLNRSDIAGNGRESLPDNVSLLAEIPYSDAIARAYADGRVPLDEAPELLSAVTAIASRSGLIAQVMP